MMVYTTITAAMQLQEARKPTVRRPAVTRLNGLSAISFPRVEISSQARKLASRPLAVR